MGDKIQVKYSDLAPKGTSGNRGILLEVQTLCRHKERDLG